MPSGSGTNCSPRLRVASRLDYWKRLLQLTRRAVPEDLLLEYWLAANKKRRNGYEIDFSYCAEFGCEREQCVCSADFQRSKHRDARVPRFVSDARRACADERTRRERHGLLSDFYYAPLLFEFEWRSDPGRSEGCHGRFR